MSSAIEETVGRNVPARLERPAKSLLTRMWKMRFIYLLLLPGIAYFVIYKYVPMVGLMIAFQDYSAFTGIWHSDWVGFAHFKEIFNDPNIVQILFNTLYLSLLQLLFAFPVGILMALMLNELRSQSYKRSIQSIVYLPHFVSWIVVIGLVNTFLSEKGIVNSVLGLLHLPQSNLLTNPHWFMPLILLEGVWKETGWGTIIFLAALSGINNELYEAAVVDGANRMRLMWHVTLPALRGTIAILLILQLGHVLDTGIEQIMLMINALTKDVGTTLDYYVYVKGILNADFSFSAAFGLFKSLIGLVLILGANRLVKKFGEEGAF
ncbi:ABC transporter permease [Paenibacillus lycopersici]|uniref:ABC transporter permease n=1 Tax=Paenibacillus lycopersici TaxID=2704462 RepID=UPI001CDB5DDB|nr:ABC transporter permease subunit [Paenibacillus lycopersici]